MSDDIKTPPIELSDDQMAPDDIPSMLLPLVGETLLLPTSAVVEMAPIQPFDIIPNTPDWFIGYYPWRNVRVPIVSYETMNECSSPKINARGRIAVLNNPEGSEKTPFVGLLIQDIPRMIKVAENDIVLNDQLAARNYDLMPVKVGVEALFIPDVVHIVSAVEGLNLLR